MLRVRHPLVSLNKATALVEMFASLALRNASALEAMLDILGARPAIEGLRARHPHAGWQRREGQDAELVTK